jgi:transposase InsO family protein
MDELYYDLDKPGSLSGIQTLARYSGRTRKEALRFLSGQSAYTIHRPVRYKFPRRRTYSKGIRDLFQADLVDMSSVANSNDRNRYILTCIDVFTKRAWAAALLTKRAAEVADRFERDILPFMGTPNLLQTDDGSEFVGSAFQSLLTKLGIRWYSSNRDIKAAVIERFNRSLKERLHRYFTYKNTNRFIDALPRILTSYNNTRHSSIKMAPNEVNSDNKREVSNTLYPPKTSLLVC